MSRIVVPKNAVEIAERSIIENALPEGYVIYTQSGGDYFIHDIYERYVGFATIIDGRVEFACQEDTRGGGFYNAVCKKYPKYNPNRIVWAVFYRWHEKHAMMGIPRDNEEEALAGLSEFEIERGAVICSFKAEDMVSSGFLLTQSSRCILSLKGDFGWDMGRMGIMLTNLESYKE